MTQKLIAAIIAIALPILFSLLVAKYPNFPLTLESVTALVLWIVGLFVAGAKARDAQMYWKFQKDQAGPYPYKMK